MRALAQQSGALRLKYLSTECAIHLAEALLGKKDYAGIQRELEPALRNSEDLGSRILLVKCHYLLATVLRASGKEAEAVRHYAEVRRILEEIRQEARSDEVMKRSDLGPIYIESARSSWVRRRKRKSRSRNPCSVGRRFQTHRGGRRNTSPYSRVNVHRMGYLCRCKSETSLRYTLPAANSSSWPLVCGFAVSLQAIDGNNPSCPQPRRFRGAGRRLDQPYQKTRDQVLEERAGTAVLSRGTEMQRP